MSAERGAASNTLEAYRRDLVDYSSFLKSRGTAVERALPEDVGAYASGLEAAGLGDDNPAPPVGGEDNSTASCSPNNCPATILQPRQALPSPSRHCQS